ncbi:MAG: TAXI family TRAP transporter solute-binding subunit [Amaricoccus sp.]
MTIRRAKRAALAAALSVLAVLSGGPAPAADPVLARTGTGSLAGVYFPVGVALCRLVNQHRPETNLRCAAQPSAGSVQNLGDLRAGTLALALVQSDSQEQALRGTGPFADQGPFDSLRAVASLYPEPLTIVARADAGIARLDDLKGKRVAIGAPGSGQRALMDLLVPALGWSLADFAATPEFPPEQLSRALCSGAIDAFVQAVGHPALVILEATSDCDTRLVPAQGPAIDRLVADHPALVEATVPGGLYRGNPQPVPTFGVSATLVTRADIPEDEIYTVTRSIFEDLPTLRGLNPALATLDPKAMATEALTAPLHPGAARYYREAGLLP